MTTGSSEGSDFKDKCVNQQYRVPTIGVEEEYQLVDSKTGILTPTCKAVLTKAIGTTHSSIQHELHLEQIEMASEVLDSTSAVRACLHEARAALMNAARTQDSVLVAAGTTPMLQPANAWITPKPR